MGAEDSGGEEEGFFSVCEELELVEGFIGRGAIRVDFIASFDGLDEVHSFGLITGFTMGEAVHPAAGVLPFPGGEEVAVPGVRHFELGGVIPIWSAESAGVVGDFSNGDGGVAICTEVGREGGVFDFFCAVEEGVVSGWAISAGEEGVAGGSAGGGLNVVLGEGTSFCGEGIDVWRVDVVFPETFELGAEVIDTDEEDVGLLGGES